MLITLCIEMLELLAELFDVMNCNDSSVSCDTKQMSNTA